MDRPTHCDELLGGHWPPGWSDEDVALADHTQADIEELEALVAQLVDELVPTVAFATRIQARSAVKTLSIDARVRVRSSSARRRLPVAPGVC